MFYLWLTLVILAFLIAVPYLGLPLLVYFTFQVKIAPQLHPFVPSPQNMWPATFQHFADSYTALEQQGFDLLICLKMPGAVEGVDSSLALLVNRQTRDMAMITAIDQQGETQTFYVEFVRRLRDGEVIQTNNSTQLSGLPDPPGTTTHRLPPVKDSARLFELHCKLAARLASHSTPLLRVDEEFGGDAIQYLIAVFPESLFEAEKLGLLYRPPGADHFRATFTGAFRLAWQELWPVSSIRKGKRDREAVRLLNDLEFAR